MDDEVQHMLLTLENFVLLRVYYQRSIIAFFLDVLASDSISNHVEMTCVICHIGSQDHAHDTATSVSFLCLRVIL